MVDYKNPARLRQLYGRLTLDDRLRAYSALRSQFVEESELRRAQGFDRSIEPTTEWNPAVEDLLGELKTGTVHPDRFANAAGHPKDPLLPWQFDGMPPTFYLYDIWCQIMARFDLDELIKLDHPCDAGLSGRLVSFEAQFNGDVADRDNWRETPVTTTLLTRDRGDRTWTSELHLKTHYIYSETASIPLSKFTENGLLAFRRVESEKVSRRRRVVTFSCTPLIIGNGVLAVD
jgi:hypothetical protein